MADQRLALSANQDDVLRTTVESILADVFIEDTEANLLDERGGRSKTQDVPSHRGRQPPPNPQSSGVQAFAYGSGLQPEQPADLRLAVPQEVEQHRDITLTGRECRQRVGEQRSVVDLSAVGLDHIR